MSGYGPADNLPSMGTTATAIAVTYSIVVVVGLVLAFAIWRSTRGVDPKEFDEKKAAEREKTWLAIVIAFLISTLLGTILLVPYGESAGPDGQVVKVVARQFGFEITPSTVTAGRVVAAIVASGRGAMPGFAGQLSEQEIDQVADFVSSTAGP